MPFRQRSTPCARTRPMSAFTLIEFSLGLAIVMILTSLFFSVHQTRNASRAREVAGSAQSARELSTLQSQYAQELSILQSKYDAVPVAPLTGFYPDGRSNDPAAAQMFRIAGELRSCLAASSGGPLTVSLVCDASREVTSAKP